MASAIAAAEVAAIWNDSLLNRLIRIIKASAPCELTPVCFPGAAYNNYASGVDLCDQFGPDHRRGMRPFSSKISVILAGMLAEIANRQAIRWNRDGGETHFR